MSFRRITTIGIVVGLAAAALLASPALGRSSTTRAPFAVLNGRPLALALVGNYYCSDLAFPKIECFTTASARDKAVSARSTAIAGVTTSVGYVVAYRDPSYSGTSVVLSQNYSNLSSIGWNDVISSYKVYTSSGAFYQNAFYAGLYQTFCCFTNVPYVGATYDNMFSSFELPPA